MIGSGPGRTAGATAAMSAYDAAAPAFDRHRALPDGVQQAIRAAILAGVEVASPRLLDVRAGTGGMAEPLAPEEYHSVALAVAFGMLLEFARRGRHDLPLPRLAQAD